jgi:Mrp family chromosome partitioning ATPase
VIIDSPPLMYVTDSVILSTLVDGVILVVQGGKSTRDVVRQSRNMLGLVGAKVFGVVLNNVSLRNLASSDFNYYPYQSTDSGEREQDRASDLLG